MKSNDRVGGEVVHYCVREQRAAFRAVRTAIDSYFLRGDDGPQALEELGKQVEALLRYARAAANMVSLRGEVCGALVEEEVGREDAGAEVPRSVGGERPEQAVEAPAAGESREERSEAQEAQGAQKVGSEGVAARPHEEDARAGRKSVAERYESAEQVVERVDASMRRKPLKSLEKGMSINDRLYFRQELCGGDAERFKGLVTLMDGAGSVEEAVRLLSAYCGDGYDGESEGVKRFVMLLEQRYGS